MNTVEYRIGHLEDNVKKTSQKIKQKVKQRRREKLRNVNNTEAPKHNLLGFPEEKNREK